MIRKLAAIIGVIFIAPAQAIPLDTASWANWTFPASGGIQGNFTQGSNNITVTYTGNAFGIMYLPHLPMPK